ncbi:MAG: VOC family protein, partial [Pseudomonadota bacterium]
ADGDHKHFRRLGTSAGRKLVFGRTFATPGGDKHRATFKLAFAADLRAPDFFAFSVQRLQMPGAAGSGLTEHANGVTGISEIIVCEPNPTDFQYFLQELTDQRETEAHSFGMEVHLENVTVNVMTPEGLNAHFGMARRTQGRGLTLKGIVFKGGMPTKGMRTHGRYAIADRQAGQGAFYAFEAR